MNSPSNPEIRLPQRIRDELDEFCRRFSDVAEMEALALDFRLQPLIERLPGWADLRREAALLWNDRHCLIVRGFSGPDMRIFMTSGLLLGSRFRSYRTRQIVKEFRMSPWTRALSHTLSEGHFHTDLNTAQEPPGTTAIQCVVPDPSSPRAGELRVAALDQILEELRRRGRQRVLDFLCQEKVSMLNDTEPDAWRGTIVTNGEIRFHPETLRAAQRRLGTNPPDLEDLLSALKETALSVSRPIHLDPGDVLFVSNRKALHYRGACTVRFHRFPTEFESRKVSVFHLMDGPS